MTVEIVFALVAAVALAGADFAVTPIPRPGVSPAPREGPR
ncbi:hypothetical protein AB0N23_06260 [Streptomyces sp. NPDC052644]